MSCQRYSVFLNEALYFERERKARHEKCVFILKNYMKVYNFNSIKFRRFYIFLLKPQSHTKKKNTNTQMKS